MEADRQSLSEKLYAEALEVLPGGISRNTVFRLPHPFYAARARGAYIYDVEGVERLDFSNNLTSLIHGHAFEPIVSAVTEQLNKGTAFTMATEVEVRFAQLLCRRVPGFDKIRFVNSGTEAVMSCIKAARAFTGKGKIAKAEGAYHGAYDYAEVSQTSSPRNWGEADRPESVPAVAGTPKGVLNDVLVFPFNDIERTLAILNSAAGEIACVLIDPMPHRIGFIPASHEFVNALAKWCRQNDALLVFDEVITFRSTYTGAQGWFDVRPDLTALGKMIGGGFPVGALAGRDEIMAVLDPRREPVLYPHSGTFSANPITMCAGRVALEYFDKAAVERLNTLAEHARKTIEDAIKLTGAVACVTGAGSLLRIHLREHEPTGYRSGYPDKAESQLRERLINELYSRNIMLTNTCSIALSTVMTEKEIESLGRALVDAFRRIGNE
jgi:glutamate-1-semialdehyde 2,1-aminomutase